MKSSGGQIVEAIKGLLKAGIMVPVVTLVAFLLLSFLVYNRFSGMNEQLESIDQRLETAMAALEAVAQKAENARLTAKEAEKEAFESGRARAAAEESREAAQTQARRAMEQVEIARQEANLTRQELERIRRKRDEELNRIQVALNKIAETRRTALGLVMNLGSDTVQFDFDTCPVVWRHRIWGAQEYTPEVSNGIFFYGEKGTVFVTDRKWIIIPKGKNKQHTVNEVSTDMGKEHMAEFLKAVRSRQQPPCTPEEGHYSTSTVKLAMIAYDLETKIYWDRDSQTIVGNPEASKRLKRNYRPPYKHPYRG